MDTPQFQSMMVKLCFLLGNDTEVQAVVQEMLTKIFQEDELLQATNKLLLDSTSSVMADERIADQVSVCVFMCVCMYVCVCVC